MVFFKFNLNKIVMNLKDSRLSQHLCAVMACLFCQQQGREVRLIKGERIQCVNECVHLEGSGRARYRVCIAKGCIFAKYVVDFLKMLL